MRFYLLWILKEFIIIKILALNVNGQTGKFRKNTLLIMSKTKILFFSLFFLLNIHGFSQDFGFTYPSDTLKFSVYQESIEIGSLDSVKGEIIETFIEPAAFLFKFQQDSIVNYSMVVKKGENYILQPMFKGIGVQDIYTYNFIRRDNSTKRYMEEIKKFKFDNEADSFLIFRFSDNTFHSNSSGFEIIQQGYYLWNINTMMVLQLINYQSVENWPYGDGMQATGSGMVRVNSYDVFFENGELIIKFEDKKHRYQFKMGNLQ